MLGMSLFVIWRCISGRINVSSDGGNLGFILAVGSELHGAIGTLDGERWSGGVTLIWLTLGPSPLL
jgi:hypothetical protein